MYFLLLGILLLSSVLLVILVLIQSGKGGGLSGAFGAGGGGESSLFGANTATVIMKATGVLATFFMISCIAVAAMQRHRSKPKFFKGIQEELGRAESEDVGIAGVEEEEEVAEGESSAPDAGDTGLTGDEDESATDEGTGAEIREDEESAVDDADAVDDAAETGVDEEKSDD